MSDEPQYERYDETQRYVNFSRWQYTIPPYLLEEMMGFSPQKRRAFVLQSRFLVPLSFLYSLLLTIKMIGYYILFQIIVKWLFTYISGDLKIITGIVLFLVFSLYLFLKWAQNKNTSTIKEELIYFSFSNFVSLTISSMMVYNQFIKMVIPF